MTTRWEDFLSGSRGKSALDQKKVTKERSEIEIKVIYAGRNIDALWENGSTK
jgi:hypothetical protein